MRGALRDSVWTAFIVLFTTKEDRRRLAGEGGALGDLTSDKQVPSMCTLGPGSGAKGMVAWEPTKDLMLDLRLPELWLASWVAVIQIGSPSAGGKGQFQKTVHAQPLLGQRWAKDICETEAGLFVI